MDKKGEEGQCRTFPSKSCCFAVLKNFVGGALLCFRNFVVSKKLREEDITNFSQEVARFPVDPLMSHSTEIIVGETVNVSESVGYRRNFCIMGVGITILHRKFSVVTVPQNFV